MTDIAAILFDKDGTLFDFRQTWSQWTADLIQDLAGERAEALGQAIGFDVAAGEHHPDSPVIAGTLDDWSDLMLPVLPERTYDDLLAEVRDRSALATQIPAAPLRPLLSDLQSAGYPLGVATNDGFAPVTRQLKDAGIHDLFTFVAGYDSGFGAKPGPGMLLGFAAHIGLPPGRIAMIGDSTHDMEAARAAGLRQVAVLTGHATERDLSPHAEVVLPSIADLHDWLAGAANPTT